MPQTWQPSQESIYTLQRLLYAPWNPSNSLPADFQVPTLRPLQRGTGSPQLPVPLLSDGPREGNSLSEVFQATCSLYFKVLWNIPCEPTNG